MSYSYSTEISLLISSSLGFQNGALMVSVPEVVACLLDNGAEVDDPGGERCGGVTPLMDSANNGHLDVVKLLVQRGANVLQKDAKVHVVKTATVGG